MQMSNLGLLEQLNKNIETLIDILKVYPSPVDEAIDSKQEAPQQEAPQQEAPQQEAPQQEAPSIADDVIIKAVREAVQRNKAENIKRIKERLNTEGVAKATDLTGEARAAFVEFAEGL